MKLRCFGASDKPALTIVGTWDPFMPYHGDLIRRLAGYSKQVGLSLAPTILIPTSGGAIGDSISYHDVEARIAFHSNCGADRVLLVEFTQDDLNKSAYEFVAVLTQEVNLSELWLGVNQTLGPSAKGTIDVIRECGNKYRFLVKTLPEVANRLNRLLFQGAMLGGNIQRARELVGSFPILHRPESLVLQRRYWARGLYAAVSLQSPLDEPLGQRITFTLHDIGLDRVSAMWPQHDSDWLAIVSGPWDVDRNTGNCGDVGTGTGA